MRNCLPIPSGLVLLVTLACGTEQAVAPPLPSGTADTARVALTDLAAGTYLGFSGGLYPGGANTLPVPHDSVGRARARAIQPRDTTGAPSPTGKIVLLSIGMSNTTQEFCSASGARPCDSWTFMGQAAVDAGVNHTTLVIANGARGGQTTVLWDSPADANYDRVRDSVLAPQGLTERQVQGVWIKEADPNPGVSLPSSSADAYALEASLGAVVRAVRLRYPNVKQVFLSSRVYGGYATTTLNPEPYAYESGFSVQWLVAAQMHQMQSGATDARAGDLNYDTVAPWLAWGPYLWANGMQARSDGLTWSASDFGSDGTHPAQSGRQKVGTMLLTFFKTSSYTSCWFLAGQTCS